MTPRRKRLAYLLIAGIAACAAVLMVAGMVQGDRTAALIGAGGLIAMAVAVIA